MASAVYPPRKAGFSKDEEVSMSSVYFRQNIPKSKFPHSDPGDSLLFSCPLPVSTKLNLLIGLVARNKGPSTEDSTWMGFPEMPMV